MFTENKILFVFIVLNFLAKIILAQPCEDTRYNITTPRGTDVPNTFRTCEFVDTSDRAFWDDFYIWTHPNAIPISLGEQYYSTATFNCHGYAWWYVEEEDERLWIGFGEEADGSEEVFFEEGTGGDADGSYDQVSEAVCSKISYNGDHSAISSGTTDWYISKWGPGPLMYHHKDDVPPYGYANQFFRRSVDVPQDKSTIASAISAAVTGQTVHVSNTQTLTGDITVPAGVTLAIKSGATVNLVNGANRYSITSTGGTITKEAGATINGLRAKLKNIYASDYRGYCGLIQTACSYAASLDVIYIEEGSFNENLSVSDVYGLKIQGVYNETIINGTVSATNCYALDLAGFDCNGIYLSVCPFGRLELINILGSGSGNGCSLYYVNNQPGDIKDVTVWNFLKGFYFFRTKWYFDNNPYGSETWILDNSTSVFTMGANITLNNTSLCGISDYHFNAYTGSVVNAYGCYFDDANPVIHSVSSQVNIYNPLECYLGKESIVDNYPLLEINNEKNPEFEEFIEINNTLDDLSRRVSNDMTTNSNFNLIKYYSDYLAVTNNLKYFIAKYPSSVYSETALTTTVFCYERIQEYKKMKLFLENIVNNEKLSTIHGLANRYLMNYYSHQEDYNSAIMIADENIKELQNDEDLLCDFLYAKGLIYAHSLKQPKEAIECFFNIVNNYPDNSLVDLTKNQLMLLGIEVKENTKPTTTTKETLEFSISSYPNPFNPTTIISYTLPEKEFVTIRVYDILGKEIAELVNEEKEKGIYTVSFDGSSLASGIYFYSMSAGKFNQVNKMILLR